MQQAKSLFNQFNNETIEHFVNGKNTLESQKTGKVYNPATGEQSAEVRLGNKDDLNKAVEVAKKAFLSWSEKPPLSKSSCYV